MSQILVIALYVLMVADPSILGEAVSAILMIGGGVLGAVGGALLMAGCR